MPVAASPTVTGLPVTGVHPLGVLGTFSPPAVSIVKNAISPIAYDAGHPTVNPKVFAVPLPTPT